MAQEQVTPELNMSGLSVSEAAQQLSDLNKQTEEIIEQGEEIIEEANQELESSTEEEPSEGEPSDGATEAETEAETVELGTDQLSHLLGLKEEQITVSDEGTISFKAKDGEEVRDVTLEKLINAYQGDAKLTNRSKELAEIRKTREGKLNEFIQQTQQSAQVMAGLLETLNSTLKGDYENINWNELKANDPAQYAALKTEKAEREQALTTIRNQAVAGIQQQQYQAAEELKSQYSEYLEAEKASVREAIPSWSSDLHSQIKDHLKMKGFSNDEIDQIADHRLLVLAHESMLMNKGKETAKTKSAKTLPKVMKPGARKTVNVDLEALKKAESAFKKTGSLKDAARLRSLQKQARSK